MYKFNLLNSSIYEYQDIFYTRVLESEPNHACINLMPNNAIPENIKQTYSGYEQIRIHGKTFCPAKLVNGRIIHVISIPADKFADEKRLMVLDTLTVMMELNKKSLFRTAHV